MADALKADGNKAFAEKKFDEAMCVIEKARIFVFAYQNHFTAINSRKRLRSSRQIMSYTRIGLVHTRPRNNLSRLLKMRTRPQI